MTGTKPEIGILDPDTYANGDPATYGLPLDQFEYLQNEEPCYLQESDDPLLLERMWVLSRHEDVWDVDRNAELYSAARGSVNVFKMNPVDPTYGGVPAMLSYDGDDHMRNRKVVVGGFTPRTVKKLEEKIRKYAVEIVDRALEKGTLDFVHDVANTMPMETLGDVVGVPWEDRPKFFGWVDKFAAPFDSRVTESFDDVVLAIGELMDYSLQLADLKRREPADDIATRLVKAHDEGTISEEELIGNIAVLASGAAESTRSAMSHGMHQLMRNPDQMAWLRARASDVPNTAVEEMVRVACPFTHLIRTATRDHELHGKQIQEGDKLMILFVAANFDPRAFDNPSKFDLSREPNLHTSFGRGQHQCMGKHVALLEMKILMEELLQRTKDITPAGEISYIRDIFSRGVYELPVTVTPK